MKKITIITGLTILTIGILGWHSKSYPQIDVPHSEANTCRAAYEDALAAVEYSWEENLQTLMDQEKAASEMVDEAFEGLRSYRCMLEYICRAVQFSGYGVPESAAGTGLTKAHIGKIPGCQAPEDIGYPSGFEEVMMSIITLGYDEPDIAYNKVPFFEQCMTDIPNRNANPNTSRAFANYDACMKVVDAKFACGDDEESLQNCLSESSAFIKMETALKKKQADQKVSAFENKMKSIMTKMHIMETHVGYLQNKLQELYNRYDCAPTNCS